MTGRSSSASRPRRTPRQHALTTAGAAHPHPTAVTDPLFQDSAFFDPHDLVQVKYEMLRSVRAGTHSVVAAAEAFGFSRPVYYVAHAALTRDGVPGLLPHKRGPKQPHKLTDPVLADLAKVVHDDGTRPSAAALAEWLAQRYGIHAHPRSIVRRLVAYLERQEKKRP